MNVTDLRQVFDERSQAPAERTLTDSRLSGVCARVRARRQRRVALAGCVVAAVAGLLAGVVLARPTHHARPQPATAQRTIDGFPEYAYGGRVVTARSAQLPVHSIELTVVPDGSGLVFYTRCDSPAQLLFSVVHGSQVMASGGCGMVATFDQLSALGAYVGQPATFVLQVTGADSLDSSSTGRTLAPPATGGYGFAIGVRVPFNEYVLPPRPSGSLAPPTVNGRCGIDGKGCPGAVVIRSDPTHPGQAISRSLAWNPVSSIEMVSQTPGYLHIRVNGVEVARGEWWDYKLSFYGASGDKEDDWRRLGLAVHAGQQVTIEVVPEYTTGAWEVVFEP